MNRFRIPGGAAWRALILAAALLAGCATGAAKFEQTALDRYLAKPDPTYEWKLVKTVPGDGVTTYIIDLKSQSWRKPPEVDRSVWQHWLIIAKPDAVKSSTSMLFIGGGSNNGKVPDGGDGNILSVAKATGTVVAELKMVPNQPLSFDGDGKERKEDDSIGYTWDKFMKTGDETWPLRLPMVKSAHRAMDTVQAFLAGADGGGVKVEKFVVAGASKRGWTTWLTGATDNRVCAIMPLVIDILNVETAMQHHWDAYGFWAPAVGNYVQHRIPDRQGTPEYEALMQIEDPYFYRARLTMPKYIINAGGDEFFLPDSSQFYYGDLLGEKRLRYIPNTKHSMQNSDVRDSILAYYELILSGKPRPDYSWTKEADGSLTVKTKEKPKQVLMWAANNPSSRDFRLDKIGPAYKSTPLADQGDGVYVAKAPKPDQGFTAFFVEMTYDVGASKPIKFTTEVSVVPDLLPFKGKPFKRAGE